MDSRKWTRREFGQGAAALAGAVLAARSSFAAQPSRAGLAFVGRAEAGGFIQVLRTRGNHWIPVSEVRAAAPAHLLLHPTLPVLYAVHHVDTWDYLPRGAVSSYRLDVHAGTLEWLQTQPLSLSATHPRHAVLTRDASHLFVAAQGGGIYNLLPVASDGSLHTPSAIRKEFGLDEHGVAKTAAPNSVALLRDGSLLAADAGQETLSTFVLDEGSLTLHHRIRVHRGEGPQQLTVSPDGRFAYTAGALRGVVHRHALVAGRATDEAEVGRPMLPASPLAEARTHIPDAISALVV